ncbi:NAD(P)-dependent oxidoreductase [Apibacter sp. HY039]|nr:NAD(P)-dependent oxidoreductase [Apibacter sp. HY039]
MDIMSLKGKKILVTGGNGYLGKHLVSKLLQEESEIFIFSLQDNNASNHFKVDISDYKQVEEALGCLNPDIIYHLAANIDRNRDFGQYEAIVECNLNGTYNLLKALKNGTYQNFIFTSSSEVYGDFNSPFIEEQAVYPASPYSLSKVYAENLIRTFSTIHDKNYTILRIFNFFGNDMPENFFIPQLINTLKRNEDFLMTEGEQIRDFLYVEDVVQALLKCSLNKDAYRETFNVCSGNGVSLKSLAQLVTDKISTQGNVRFGAIPYRENEIWEMVGSNAKIKNKLGFSIKFSLENALEECLKNY